MQHQRSLILPAIKRRYDEKMSKCTTEMMWVVEKHFRARCLLCTFLFLPHSLLFLFCDRQLYMFWQKSRWLCSAFFFN